MNEDGRFSSAGWLAQITDTLARVLDPSEVADDEHGPDGQPRA